MIDCIEYADAPFCAGESLKECPQGTEVPETASCGTDGLGGNVDALGVPDEEMYSSCEIDGTCDDSCSPPARDDCTLPTTEVAVPPTPAAELPQTGAADLGILFAAGLTLIITGTRLARQRLEH